MMPSFSFTSRHMHATARTFTAIASMTRWSGIAHVCRVRNQWMGHTGTMRGHEYLMNSRNRLCSARHRTSM